MSWTPLLGLIVGTTFSRGRHDPTGFLNWVPSWVDRLFAPLALVPGFITTDAALGARAFEQLSTPGTESEASAGGTVSEWPNSANGNHRFPGQGHSLA